MKDLDSISKQIIAKKVVYDQLQDEERLCMDRLAKVKKELELVRDFAEKQEEEIDDLKMQKKKKEKEIKLIDNSLDQLKQEH